MEWLMAIMGIASLVGSFVYGSQQKKKEEQTEQYNKDLNQTVMDREDNAWQRAVEDRSKSGLSVAGLSQGAGSGGTVSQLQAPQGNAMMANLMQNLSGQSFGLASSAYENRKNRQLQSDNFQAELQLKKEQLDTDILNAKYQRMKILAEIVGLNDENSRQQGIYNHNMKIARGEEKNPLSSVYGSQPSEIERIIQALVNNKDDIFDSLDTGMSQPSFDEVQKAADSAMSKTSENKISQDNFSSKLKEAIGEFTFDRIPKNKWPTNIAVKYNGGKNDEYVLILNDGSTMDLSKSQYEKAKPLFGKK